LIFERYLPGNDEVWGRNIGNVAFGPDTLHDMRSVTKSIVGLLYGIALDRRQVPPPDQPLLAQFPEYSDLAKDANRARLTIAHVLTMTLAMDWNEDLPYSDPRNGEAAMERASDRFRYILERPMLGEPGRGYIYNGGATALLGRLIERGTRTDLHSFGKSALFEPLGIRASEWTKGTDGLASAASGLRLSPRDLARIGQLIAAGGTHEGQRIISTSWLEVSFRQADIVDDGRWYGYHWYLGQFALAGRTGTYPAKWIGAFGLGGQRLFVFPDLDFVLAITAGNYSSQDQWKPPIAILREVFLAGLVE
jgi:CubicO group peptidase (beta-lactamase class C family)